MFLIKETRVFLLAKQFLNDTGNLVINITLGKLKDHFRALQGSGVHWVEVII